MRFVIAPDSFKGSVTSVQAAQSLAAGVKKIDPAIETITIPMADGGEGTVEALLSFLGGEKIHCSVLDPLGREIKAPFGWVEDKKLAVVETAAASGLPLLSDSERNPHEASTFGTGQLIKAALEKGAETIILGIGGSATVDGGSGCFEALGVEFFDSDEKRLVAKGRTLGKIARINTTNLSKRLKEVRFIVASDVTNPLLGEKGAVTVFGPQKGVQEHELSSFEEGMANYAKVVEETVAKKWTEAAGSGAAGGFGFGLRAFLDVEMKSGFDLIAELSGLEEEVKQADAVLTGEGKIDEQSLYGKVPVGIARLARKFDVPVAVFAGKIEGDLQKLADEGLTIFMPIVDEPMTLQEAMAQGEELLYRAGQRFVLNRSGG